MFAAGGGAAVAGAAAAESSISSSFSPPLGTLDGYLAARGWRLPGEDERGDDADASRAAARRIVSHTLTCPMSLAARANELVLHKSAAAAATKRTACRGGVAAAAADDDGGVDDDDGGGVDGDVALSAATALSVLVVGARAEASLPAQWCGRKMRRRKRQGQETKKQRRGRKRNPKKNPLRLDAWPVAHCPVIRQTDPVSYQVARAARDVPGRAGVVRPHGRPTAAF